ncbi:MAG: DUF86 domain-containing protein [Armatimonadota bacterium]
MKKNNFKDNVYLKHVFDAVKNIENFTRGISKAKFIKSILIQSAVIRQLEVIGEAVKNVSVDLKRTYSEIKWKDIAGARDKLIHDYFGVDLELVWSICKKDIPVFKKQVRQILKDCKFNSL